MVKMSDNEIGLSYSRREEEGFTVVYNRLFKPLVVYAIRMLVDFPDRKEMAEDIVQNVIILAWEVQSKTPITNYNQIKDYLFTAVRHTCVNTIKTSNKTIREVPEIPHNIEIQIGQSDGYYELYQALSSLPTQCRHILIMRYFCEMSVKEIETKMKLANTSVKNQLSRAMMLLRKKFNISEFLIKEKHDRWVKSIYFSEGNIGKQRLYGISRTHISMIRQGSYYENITKDL